MIMFENQDPLLSQLNNWMQEGDQAIRRIFGRFIKGNFLIKMKYLVIERFPDFYRYYDMSLSMDKIIAGNELVEFDLCRTIVGCHSSNIIFLNDAERVQLERDKDYQEKLANNVIENIKLRGYGSAYFRRQPIMQGELFLAHNVPYNMFVLALRMNELLRESPQTNSKYQFIYSSISNKSLACLSLLEDNFLENCYPICRAIIELYLKLLIFHDYPELVEEHYKFNEFEIRQSCCEQEYPEEFNNLFQNRTNRSYQKKIDYLHYGWLDKAPNYHNVIKQQPYSISGLLNFLRLTHQDSETQLFDNLEFFYKMCHGYTHGNVGTARYPLLHYFEVSIILQMTVLHSYILLSNEKGGNKSINGIDVVEKAERDFEILKGQYEKKSTELFEAHYKRLKY